MADTTLQLLLKRLASERAGPLPEPAAPMSLGPLSTDTSAAFAAQNPEPVPPLYSQPTAPDMGFVNQYAGQEPVRPVIQPATKLQRIAAALTGFGMGMEGRGAEYLRYLRDERDRPIREYEQQRGQYEERRTRGLELAERRAEREADRINRAAELQYEREFSAWKLKLGIRKDEADERTRQAFEVYKLDRQEKIEEARERRRDLRQREDEAKHISDQYWAITRNKNLSDEIGGYKAGLLDRPMSPQAVALFNRVTQLGQVQMRRAFSDGRGGGAGGVGDAVLRAAGEVEAAKGALIQLRQRGGSVRDERLLRRRIDRAVGNLRRFPGRAQGGLDASGWPWVEVWNGEKWVGIVPDSGGAQQQPGAPQPQADPLGILR